MSVPMLMGNDAFSERDLLICIAAGVILLSLIAACIALPLLLRGIEASPDDKRRNEVRNAWNCIASVVITRLVMTYCVRCWGNWI
jgi:CPA1 family monovalent cation:H+ antiporter